MAKGDTSMSRGTVWISSSAFTGVGPFSSLPPLLVRPSSTQREQLARQQAREAADRAAYQEHVAVTEHARAEGLAAQLRALRRQAESAELQNRALQLTCDELRSEEEKESGREGSGEWEG